MFAILHIQNLAFANIIPILFTALLVIGVWKERPKLMRPFVVLAVSTVFLPTSLSFLPHLSPYHNQSSSSLTDFNYSTLKAEISTTIRRKALTLSTTFQVIVFIFTIINVPLMVVALFVPDSWAFSFYGQHVMPDGVMGEYLPTFFRPILKGICV